MFHHLLLPLDGSQLAEAALPVAAALARALGARLTLLHIAERSAPATVHGERHLRDMAEAQRYLEGVAGGLTAAGLTAAVHCHEAAESDVARSVAAHASEVGADLVVLCTHGRGGLRDVMTGSIAQQALRQGDVPVLIIRPAGSGTAFAPRAILVPLDGSASDETALAAAAALAGALEAHVRLLRVVPTQATVRGDTAATALLLPAATAAALDLATEQARADLDTAASRLRAQGLSASGGIQRGDVVEQLTVAADEADLIVMATHGRAGLDAFWSGSIAARLLARIACPTLLLRAPE